MNIHSFVVHRASPDQIDNGLAIWSHDLLVRGKVSKHECRGLFFFHHPKGVYSIHVEIGNDSIDSSCDCIHPLFSLCEHQIGGILTLADILKMTGFRDYQKGKFRQGDYLSRYGKTSRFESNKEPRPLKRKDASELYEILPWNDLEKFIKNCKKPRLAYSFGALIKPDQNCLVDGKFIFEVRDSSYSSFHTVEISYVAESWYTRCQCHRKGSPLCGHEHLLFETIVYGWQMPRLLDIEKESTGARQEVMQEFNLSATEVDTHFRLGFINGEFIYWAREHGLRGKSGTQDIVKVLANLRDDDRRLSLNIPRSPGLQEEQVYAFLVGESGGFAVIAGKPSKKGAISTHIHTKYRHDLPPEWEPVKEWFKLLEESPLPNGEGYWYFMDTASDQAACYEAMMRARPFLKTVPVYFNNNLDRISRNSIQPLSISDEVPVLEVEFSEDSHYYVVQPVLKFGENSIHVNTANDITFLPDLMIYDNQLWFHPSLEFGDVLLYLEHIGLTRFIKQMQADCFTFVSELSQFVPIRFNIDISHEEIPMGVEEARIYLFEKYGSIVFQSRVMYDNGVEISLFQPNDHLELTPEKIRHHRRDRTFEDGLRSSLLSQIPEFETMWQTGLLYLPIEQVTEREWFFRFLQWASANKVEIYGQNDLPSLRYSTKNPSLNIQLSSGMDWFGTHVDMQFDDEKIPLSQLKRVIGQGDEFVRLKDGSLGIIPEVWRKQLETIFRVGTVSGDEVRISKLQFNIIDELFETIDEDEIRKEIDKKKQQLASFEHIAKAQLPFSVTADLRPYQKEGFHWLCFLEEFGFGGCLADDMGLGKTVQVLCIIAKAMESGTGTSLIVVPRSLLFNWENEIQKFCPSLKYVLHHGTQRSKKVKELGKYDVVISTYGTAMRDIEMLRKIEFSYVVLDESQAIKNPTSKSYKTVRLLQGRNRLVMTGTPIENNTFDLYAQLSFVNPGLLGSQKSFLENYVKPIDMHQDADRARELQRIIHPFLLRRTKEQVATDLPGRSEQILYCELPSDQRKLYELYRRKYAKELDDLIASSGLNRSKIHVLEGLTRLRQLCNAPELVSQEHANVRAEKLDLLTEQLASVTSNHKALVFSQFVGMLQLIRHRLEAEDIPYYYLDGKTKDRKTVVEEFQNSNHNCVFLISLKAGGTGLNLTSAEYVFIVDPWWNPAAEQQAIDRTHRIGQSKPVIAYKMICKDTIEEKILKLQQRKKQIASDIIRTEDSMFKSLTREDISHLFS